METLVLPAQDQLSQHQYWQKRNVLDHLFSPRSTPPRSRKPDPLLAPSKSYMSSAPSSPVYRSIHRTTSADFSSSLAHSSSLSGSSTEVARPSTASGGRVASKGRASPVKKSFENAPKGNKGPGNKAAYVGKPSKSKAPNLPNGKISESSGNNSSSSRDMSIKAKPKSGFAKKTERNGSYQKKEDAGSPPKITILQRPQSKEAAMLDLAKITGLPLSEVYAKNGLPIPEQNAKVEHKPEPVKTKSTRVRANKVENKVEAAPSPPPEAGILEVGEVKVNNKVGVEETTTTTTAGTIKAEEDVLGPFTRNFGEAFLPPPLFDEKWAEKWAGPAFTNSPPPSSLPIPNFPLMKKTDIVAQVEFGRIDTEAATKGLRRILNLDF